MRAQQRPCLYFLTLLLAILLHLSIALKGELPVATYGPASPVLTAYLSPCLLTTMRNRISDASFIKIPISHCRVNRFVSRTNPFYIVSCKGDRVAQLIKSTVIQLQQLPSLF